jgi:hypothetical protein
VDDLVCYVGTLGECRRRAVILAPQPSDREALNWALGRLLRRIDL